jgi:aspartate kinase
MLTVEKIGGTSMSRFGELMDTIIIGKRAEGERYGRIFVVSAYADVTNWLLEHKKSGEPGAYQKFAEGGDYRQALDSVLARLKAINAGFSGIGLDVKAADAFIEERIRLTREYLDSMAHVLSSGYVERSNILLAAREMLASIGESHSAFNSALILRSRGLKAAAVDLSGFDDDEPLSIDDRIRKSLAGLDFSKVLPIVTGYAKGTEGIMREFDRGYSEVTFSKVAVIVKADEAVIHKEFHLLSADPRLVGEGNAVIVGTTNFDVADQLADVGMEAIHPKASKPIETNGIRLRVRNAFDPDHPGTLITKAYAGEKARVEMVTGSEKVTLVDIHDPSMVGAVGFDLDVMRIFSEHAVSYIMKATNANSISMVVLDRDATAGLISRLEEGYQTVTAAKVAIVCVMGSNITIPGVLAKAARALADSGVNVICVSQAMRQVNMQFVVRREDYQKAVKALNDELCLDKGRA